MYLEHLLTKKPIIAAIKDVKDLEKVPKENIAVIFILRGKLSNLKIIINKAIELDALVFLHLDMVKGIGNDKEAIKYLASEIGIDGIVTTKGRLIKAAKKENLIAVQRLFLLDSESLKTGQKMLKSNKPDLVEVLPAPIIPKLIDELRPKIKVPIIAGGLVKTKKQVEDILATGVLGISTSQKELWNFKLGK